jgi:hypothetical protein
MTDRWPPQKKKQQQPRVLTEPQAMFQERLNHAFTQDPLLVDFIDAPQRWLEERRAAIQKMIFDVLEGNKP